MKIYFVVTAKSSAEIEAIREIQPPRLLLSFYYFRNKPLSEFIRLIRYNPDEIMLDSGAYSAAKDKGIALTDYMRYIQDNHKWIAHYMNLDVLGDNSFSFAYYNIMRDKGFSPIPVIQFGSDDEQFLKKYIALGVDHVALGGTASFRNKWDVSRWCSLLIWQYPKIRFHLLGSSSRKIIDFCNLDSCDSSTWFLSAVNGYPRHIEGRTREAKIKRAKWQLKQMTEFEKMLMSA